MVEAPRVDFARIGAVLDHLPHLAPIDAVVLVEVAVFGRDHGVLELRRDAAQRHEGLALLVRAGVKNDSTRRWIWTPVVGGLI